MAVKTTATPQGTSNTLSFKTIAVSGQSDVVADSTTDTLTLAAGSNITLTTNAGADTVTIAAAAGGSPTRSITCGLDGGGAAIAAGTQVDVHVPYACTITEVTMLADQSGSIVVDIWKDSYANYPPTNADSITASATPTISAATKSQDSTLTGWTTSVSAGDTLRFNVDSCTSITKLSLVLKVTA